MSYCKYCGKELANGEEHVCERAKASNAWTKIKEAFELCLIKFYKRVGIGDSGSTLEECFERGKQIAPGSIELDDGEFPVKQYNVATLRSRIKFEKAEGRLQLTNKRVLFRANGHSPGGKITYQHSFSLDKIDGLEIRKDYRFRIPDLLFALYVLISTGFFVCNSYSYAIESRGNLISALTYALVGIAFCVPFFTVFKRFYLKLFMSAIGASILGGVMIASSSLGYVGLNLLLSPVTTVATYSALASAFLCCLKPNLVIEVKTSSGSPGIQLKHKEISFVWHKSEEFSGFSEIMPAKDTELAIKEVATIIDDIKTLGDLGVEKWKQN